MLHDFNKDCIDVFMALSNSAVRTKNMDVFNTGVYMSDAHFVAVTNSGLISVKVMNAQQKISPLLANIIVEFNNLYKISTNIPSLTRFLNIYRAKVMKAKAYIDRLKLEYPEYIELLIEVHSIVPEVSRLADSLADIVGGDGPPTENIQALPRDLIKVAKSVSSMSDVVRRIAIRAGQNWLERHRS